MKCLSDNSIGFALIKLRTHKICGQLSNTVAIISSQSSSGKIKLSLWIFVGSFSGDRAKREGKINCSDINLISRGYKMKMMNLGVKLCDFVGR